MEITVDQESFLDGLQRVALLAERKNLVQIGSFILIEARDQKAILFATDNQTGGRFEVPCEVRTPGKTTVAGKKIHQLFRELPAGKVSLTRLDNGSTRIERERLLYDLKGIDPEEYVGFPEIKADYSFLVSLEQISGLIRKTLPFVLDDDSKPMNGVLFHRVREGSTVRLNIVGTDGHRLHHGTVLLGEDAGFDLAGQTESRFILRKKTLQDLLHVLDLDLKSGSISVEVVVNPKYATFRWGGFYYYTRLLGTPFPNYRDAFPSQFNLGIECSRSLLESSIRRMSLVSDKKAEIVFSWDARSLTLSTRNEEIGESTETLPVFLKGSPGSLVFNTDQIRTLLQVCQGETMRMDAVMDPDPAKSSSMPSIWSCAEESDSRYVIMPLESAD